MKQFSIHYVRGSSELNKILKEQKKTREKISILYVTPWEAASTALETKVLRSKIDNPDATKKLYLVDIFETPYGTAIFNINKLPAFVTVKDRSRVEDYLPNIYKLLGM